MQNAKPLRKASAVGESRLGLAEAIKKHFNNIDNVPNGQIQRTDVVRHDGSSKSGRRERTDEDRSGKQGEGEEQRADDRGRTNSVNSERPEEVTPQSKDKKEVGQDTVQPLGVDGSEEITFKDAIAIVFQNPQAASQLLKQRFFKLAKTLDIPAILTPFSGDVDPLYRIMVQRT